MPYALKVGICVHPIVRLPSSFGVIPASLRLHQSSVAVAGEGGFASISPSTRGHGRAEENALGC
jgi:hypothetical protein